MRFSNKQIQQRRKVLWAALVTLVVLLVICVVYAFTQNSQVIIRLEGAKDMTLEYGESYTESGADAWYVRVLSKKQHDLEVAIEGEVDAAKLGEYKITYSAEFGDSTKTVVRTVRVVDTKAPEITLTANPDSYTLLGHEYQEEGFAATDNYDGDLTAKVERRVDGTKVIYTVTDSSGNKASVTREIVINDPEAPVISLKGGTRIEVLVGTSYTEPGYEATDNADGTITDRVKVTGTVNAAVEGTYTVKYIVSDTFGNITEVVRTVEVKKDSTKPVITLKGSQRLTLKVGSKYVEAGYTASDNIDGDLTAAVTVTSTVNTAVEGEYKVTYTVTDKSGNKATAVRTVIVSNKASSKVIYLTFDDGPNQNTAKLLPILKKYNVKATFFVSAQFPGYLHLLKNIVDDGHSIALHTATHVYSQIYASEAAYFADLEKIQNIVLERTGVKTMLMRFPGGSNNTVGKISMRSLTKAVTQRGFVYFDWNVDSSDAYKAKTAAAVYNNVVNGCSKRNESVVLMHDIHKHTVDAVEDILKWGLANGYTFATLDESGPTCQFIKP